MPAGLLRHATRLETVSVRVSSAAAEAYEAALAAVCGTVGCFIDEDRDEWIIEGVKPAGEGEDALVAALAIAAAVTGESAPLARTDTPADGWLARSYSGFPEQYVGRRFVIRGTHLPDAAPDGRIALVLDAGVAFGSGEHGSTRGCLRALEALAHRRPARILDLGTGSGILAMSAARIFPAAAVLATDIDPWAVRTAAGNARMNRLATRIRFRRADGFRDRTIRAEAPYDLVFANILARPLCRMAADLAAHLAPGGLVVLSGLLAGQARMVIAAYRTSGLLLRRIVLEERWATLVLAKGA